MPYHAKLLADNYGVGLGILSMQGEESKHSAIKAELKSNTNRSMATDKTGKWYQLMRADFIRTFHLPYHMEIADRYQPHSTSRLSSVTDSSCHCSRKISSNLQMKCTTCLEATEVQACADKGKLEVHMLTTIFPFACSKCMGQFADIIHLNSHKCCAGDSSKNPKQMSVHEVRSALL